MEKESNRPEEKNGQAPLPVRNPASDVQKIMEARAKQLTEDTSPGLPEDEAFRKKFPQLWDLLQPQRLTAAGKKWDRRPPSLLMTMESGGWRAVVRDNDLAAVWAAFDLTFDGALKALEKSVADPRQMQTIRSRSKGLKPVVEKK